jgi:hypothetical protein
VKSQDERIDVCCAKIMAFNFATVVNSGGREILQIPWNGMTTEEAVNKGHLWTMITNKSVLSFVFPSLLF